MNKFTEAQQKFFDKIRIGQKLNGKVVNFTRLGAFVNVGLINGLIATKDIAWGRIQDPEDALKLRQKVEVVVLDKDERKQYLSLGLKQLQEHPWEKAKSKYKAGDTVIGHVVDVQPYGAFLEIIPGFEGLVHISRIGGDIKIENAKNYFEKGQAFEATIVKFDFENRKLELSVS